MTQFNSRFWLLIACICLILISGTAAGSSFIVADFSTDVSDNEGVVPLTVNFTDESTNTTCWEWDVNGDGTVDYTTKNVTHTYTSEGSYNVTLKAINANGEDSASQTIIVRSKTFFTGDRVWDALKYPSLTYKWDYNSFSGFYFDLDTGKGSEELTITLGGIDDRSIDDEDIQYIARPVDTDFEHAEWGSYQVIGFMGGKYFAGYTNDSVFTDAVSLMSESKIGKVLIDDDTNIPISPGSEIELEEGCFLNIVEVDTVNDNIFVSLTRDGLEVDSAIVSTNGDYVYKKDFGYSVDIPVVVIHFNKTSSSVFIDGIFQIYDEYLVIETGDTYSEMEVSSISSTQIKMENDNSVSLSKGKTVDLMGKLLIEVADADELRFAPVVDRSEPGTYELRGTVVEDETSFEWTPLNFEGFYYDIDEGVRTETLEATIDGRSIDDGDLVYSTVPAMVEFEHDEWGGIENTYCKLGFLTEEYVPVNGNPGKLVKLLEDNDDKYTMRVGQSLEMSEGYEITLRQAYVEDDMVWLVLSRHGEFISDKVLDLSSGESTWVYSVDVAGEQDVEVFRVHVTDVFQGQIDILTVIEGFWLIDYENVREVKPGDNYYGELEVKSISTSGITMRNDDDIVLTRGSTLHIAENLCFKVADDDQVRFYPLKMDGFYPLSYDSNLNGMLEKEEVIDSIIDYFDNKITKEEVIEVIIEYFRN